MIFTETLSHNKENYVEMRQVCSNWEHTAKEKMAEYETKSERVFKFYLAAKNVCEFSYYRFRKSNKKSFLDYDVDVAYDNKLNLLGFSLSKIIEIKSSLSAKPYQFLFLHFLTTDPNQFESVARIKNVGDVMLKRLQKRCLDKDLDGIFSEPVMSAMPFFHSRKFVDTELKKGQRKAVLLFKKDFSREII